MESGHRLVIQGEVTTLLSVMRGRSRWGDNEQNILQKGLRKLSEQILRKTGSRADIIAIIRPFCEVVINEETTGPVTGQAIFSLDKFLCSGLFDPQRSSTPQAIMEVAEAVTHARFIGTNSSDDEVVLMRILRILSTLLSIPAGRLLTNECVCEIMQSCFRICFEGRLSELLHYFAENTLIEMMKRLFSSLESLNDVIPDHDNDLIAIDKQHKSFVRSRAPTGDDNVDETDIEEHQDDSEVAHISILANNSDPHGMPCVREILKFVIAIINPRDKNNTNRLISIGLGLVTVLLESSGSSVSRVKSLIPLLQDGLCHHLTLLLSSDNLHVFTQTLRNFFLLIECGREILKFQIEKFFSLMMDILKNDKQVPFKQELCLECIVQLCHIEGLISELYVNYDCCIHCTNVFERLNKHLSKLVLAGSTGVSSTSVLALDTILAVISSLESYNESHDGQLESSPTIQHSSFLSQSAGVIFSTSTIVNNDSGDDMSKDYHQSISQPDLTIPESLQYPGSPSDLLKSRQLKKLIVAGTDQFNKKPSGGLSFLMEQGVLQTPLDPWEVARFLHSNPNISKHKLGDYLGTRKNSSVLEAYVKSFSFNKRSLVDSLRDFLESFRLPGEAPVISNIMEMFSKHWMDCNRDGYADLFDNNDSVFVLCYAILMLHTDLHSSKLKQKMSLEEFITTRRGMNNGKDFPRQLLVDIYNSIQSTEIVLPSEQSGIIKEDYEWKMLLSRKNEVYYRVSTSTFNQDVFYLLWGSASAAMSSALDNWSPSDSDLYTKIMSGYKLCASISSQYRIPEVFDNLIIQLSKFTSLLLPHEQPPLYTIAHILNTDDKARISFETLFSLAHSYGNLLREGWKNILDCLGSLFNARLLPEAMVKVRDFMSSSGAGTLYSDEAPAVRPDSSLLSTFFSYNYWAMAGEAPSQSSPSSLSPSEVKRRNTTIKWIQGCGIESLFNETKFLCEESLIELKKALVFSSHGPDVHQTLGTSFDEDNASFHLEVLVNLTLDNRDRVELLLEDIINHLGSIIQSKHPCRKLRERAVIAMMNLSIKLIHKACVRSILFQGLQNLLQIPFEIFQSFRVLQRQLASALTDLVISMNVNDSCSSDWIMVFSLFELSSIGTTVSQPTELSNANTHPLPSAAINRFDLLVEESLPPQDPESFVIVCEALSYMVRHEQSIHQHNFTLCLRTVRIMTEVTGTRQALKHDKTQSAMPPSSSLLDDTKKQTYANLSVQLLDLLDTLFLRISSIFEITSDASDGVSNMWNTCWCPLLEGIARMCCDPRNDVRQLAVSYLQRALLGHTLQVLEKHDWEACFLEVFFPMLSRLMEDEGKIDIEETRMRACNLLCKVFLQRLPQLSSLSTFTELWIGILDTMDKYMHIEGSDLLPEAIPESLKNMLLVMETQGVLHVGGSSEDNQLWGITQQRIEQFLPTFISELFPAPQSCTTSGNSPSVGTRPVVDHQPTSHSPSLSYNSSSEDDGETSNSSFPVVIHPPLPTPSVIPITNHEGSPPD